MAISTPSPLTVVAASVALSIICIISVALRFWTRHLLKTGFMLDDWLTLPALLLTLGMSVAIIIGVRLKALAYPTPLSHSGNPFSSSFDPIKAEWAIQLIQVLQLGLVKLSFLFLFRRIFSVGNFTLFDVVNLVMIVLIILWAVAFFFAFLFACRGNFAAWWISLETLRTCIPTIPLENGFALSDFIMDFIIIAMPIPMILGLHMSAAQKIGVIATFALGALAVVASIVRLAIFYRANVAFKLGIDNHLLVTQILFWIMVESNLALIAACLPLLHGLLQKISLESMVRSIRRLKLRGSLSSGVSRGSYESRSSNTAIIGMENRNDATASHA